MQALFIRADFLFGLTPPMWVPDRGLVAVAEMVVWKWARVIGQGASDIGCKKRRSSRGSPFHVLACLHVLDDPLSL